MSIKNGSLALTLFRIEGDMRVASSVLNAENLFIRRFRPIDDLPERVSVGFTSFDDPLDETFSKAHPMIGEYLAFALRVDKRVVPPAVLKKHHALALKKEEEANRESGKKFVSRERKKELRESALLRLMVKAEPIPVAYEAVVNTRTGLVFLASASKGVADLFQERFAAAFNLTLSPLDAGTLVGEPEAGRAFLTRVFSRGMTFAAKEVSPDAPAGEVVLSFAGRVVVVDEHAELSGMSRNGGDIAEIEAGVAAGKEVVKLGLSLDWDLYSFSMVLDQDLRITGLRLPAGAGMGFADDDRDGAFLERMYLIEKAFSAVRAACALAWNEKDKAKDAGAE